MAFFNPFRPAYLDDPYPILHRLRREEPVHWSPELDAWVVTSYEACLRIIQDDDAFSSDPGNAGGAFGARVRERRAHAPLGTAPIMGNTDPPGHTRLRAIVNRGFTPRAIEAMAPAIETAADALLDELPGAGPFDVISRFAEPLAVSVVLDHLGVPREQFGVFREWSLALMRARAEGAETPGVVEAAEVAREQMLGLLAGIAEKDDAGESPSVVRVLIEACDDGIITPDEMVTMLIHVSLAGNGPTAMAFGNAISALAEHPEAQYELRRSLSLVPAAVEELLRFDSSTHYIVRFALQDARAGTRTIRAGQQVHVMVGAANRDPERFRDPDCINFARPENRHLSFGHGIHFCLGAPLARLEQQVALRRFLERVPPFRAVERERAPSYQVRGLRRLVIAPAGAPG